MATGLDFPTFYDRFEYLRRNLCRCIYGQMALLVPGCAGLALVVLATLDYQFELPRTVRIAGLTIGAAVMAATTLGWGITRLRKWTRPETAATLERAFPQLGQRVRTAIRMARQAPAVVESQGMAPGLVRALQTDLAVAALPLPLESLLPRTQLVALATGVVLGLGALGGSFWLWPEWQTALRRCFLIEEPFSRLELPVGDIVIEKGQKVTLRMAVLGRQRSEVTLLTRPPGKTDSGWVRQALLAAEAERRIPGESTFAVPFTKVSENFEFQWQAGPLASPIHRVTLRIPLTMDSLSAKITPPAYTQLPVTVSHDMNLSVLESSHVAVTVTLSDTPVEATVKWTIPSTEAGEDLVLREPAEIIGNQVRFERTCQADMKWSLEAKSAGGAVVAKNSQKIRVREDQPPTLAFEAPDAALDVHSLAEVLMRVRARDDFGLVRAGIVFQINNDEEHTLFAEDYRPSPISSSSPDASAPTMVDAGIRHGLDEGSPAPLRTTALLERLLPLEPFQLMEKDSLTYYAFAEDNRPSGSQRIESELRFIDIRPFKVTYRMPPPRTPGEDGGGENGPRRATFEELIARQRSVLNRTLAIKRLKKQDLAGLDRLIEFENDVAVETLRLAEFLQTQNFDRVDLLLQAQKAMLDSSDSLSIGKFDVAMLQEKDAVRFLVESREQLEIFLQSEETPTESRNAINQFFRRQLTKLRKKVRSRPPSEESKLRSFVEDLEKLAAGERMVADRVAASAAETESEPAETPVAAATPPDPSDATSASSATSGTAESTVDTPNEATISASANRDPGTDPLPASESKGDALPAETSLSEVPDKPNPPAGTGIKPAVEITPGNRQDLRKEGTGRAEQEMAQNDLLTLAEDLQKQAIALDGLTPLAKARFGLAIKAVSEASASFGKGRVRDTRRLTETAADDLERLVPHIKALLASDLAEQLMVASDLAANASQDEAELAEALGNRNPSKGPTKGSKGSTPEATRAESPEENAARGAGLSKLADRISNNNASLLDVLQNILKQGESAGTLGPKLSELLDKGGLAPAIERSQEQATRLKSGGTLDESRLDEQQAARDVASALAAAAQRLDQLRREIVAPELAALMELEKQAAQLMEKSENDPTSRQMAAIVKEAEELADKAEGLGLEDEAQQLRKLTGGGLNPPDAAKSLPILRALTQALRARVQQLVLAEFASFGTETPPSEYREMVGKYQKTLTSGPRDEDKPVSSSQQPFSPHVPTRSVPGSRFN